MDNASELYQRQIADRHDEHEELMHQVWDGTPWMVDAYTGSLSRDTRWRDIKEWCQDNFGPEAWPIHGKPGDWYSGGATVNGWTWMGFKTKYMMDKFLEVWDQEDA